MTSTIRGTQILSSFKTALRDQLGISLKPTSISRQVYQLETNNNCLLYVKTRSDYPIKWGVTKNVIDRLSNQDLPWAVILLFLSHESGYLLSSDDVEYYINNVWPLGSDGDYKPAEGSYLSRNYPFNSVLSLLDEIKSI